MQPPKKMQFVDLKWRIPVLIVLVLLMELAFSQTRGENGLGARVQAATRTDAATQVTITNYAYNPADLTVKAGTTVVWINHDSDPHTVDNAQGKFKSAMLETNDKFEFRFAEAGEYPFFCRFHPKMTGKIIVRPGN